MERLRRWCVRNPIVASLTVSVVLALTSGTIISTLLYLTAEAARETAISEKKEADRSFEQAITAVEEFYTVVSEETLLNEPGMQDIRQRLLQKLSLIHI